MSELLFPSLTGTKPESLFGGHLFSCLTIPRVDVKVVNSIATENFISCLRRFINRHGDVKELRCDNG